MKRNRQRCAHALTCEGNMEQEQVQEVAEGMRLLVFGEPGVGKILPVQDMHLALDDYGDALWESAKIASGMGHQFLSLSFELKGLSRTMIAMLTGNKVTPPFKRNLRKYGKGRSPRSRW